jgi:hypothetical protein
MLPRNLATLGGLLLVSANLAACGGTPLTPVPTGGAAGGAGASSAVGGNAGGAAGSGLAGSSGFGGATVSPCPAQPPADGASCSHEGLACSWGDDVRGDDCRTGASCTSSHWQVTVPSTAECPPFSDSGACPSDTSGACTENTTCAMANGIQCRCVSCRPNAAICPVGPPAWYCPMPETVAGCPPTTEPNFGIACTAEGAVCTYFSFMCGQRERICSHGIWTPGQVIGCPVSTRRAKKDIHYLSVDEIDATASQALRLRLATYEYKMAPYAGRRHLGFIIEDSPSAPAVDRDGDMVDLYGYASMLVATTQAQQRQIEALQKQVEALNYAVDRMRRSTVRAAGN